MNAVRYVSAMIAALLLLTACGDESATEVGAGVPLTIPLTSPAFDAEGPIPAEYTCGGSDTSPPLRWDSVPDEARSLVLICDDPDAPGGTWVHWVFYDLPPDMTELPARIPAVANPPAGGPRVRTTLETTGMAVPVRLRGMPTAISFGSMRSTAGWSLRPGRRRPRSWRPPMSTCWPVASLWGPLGASGSRG
jgi:hypothetical protein